MSVDPHKQALLEERARKLAARGVNSARRELFDEVAVIEVGRERYGLSLAHLREISRATPIAPLPSLPSFMLGVTAVRGELVSVVDVAELRGSGRTGNSAFYALVEVAGRSIALCFNTLVGIRGVFADEIAPELLTPEFVASYTRAITRDFVRLLDIPRFLDSERLCVRRSGTDGP